MDDKGFWDDLMQGGDESQAKQSVRVTDPALIPGYRAEDKPTATGPPEERNLDIESILADIRKRTEGGAEAPEPTALMQQTDELPADKAVTDTPPNSYLSSDEPDEKQFMQSMLAAVHELTQEVKQLRSQLETRPYNPAHCPSERPPGIEAGAEDSSAPETKPTKKNKVVSIISSVLFYAVIVAMVVGAFLMRSTSKGEPFMIAGFSAANVLTSSMEDVYPKGSLIITRQVDATKLQIGDDITFMVSEESSVTHRIIEITEDYQSTGERAFKTQGTMNAKPDKEMVAAANVVGKVIFHSKALGDFANFVKANWPILIFVLIVIIALISFLKWNMRRDDGDEKNLSAPTPSPKKESRTKRRLRKSKEEVE